MTVLLDANVLISLVVADHVHHGPAEEWLAASGIAFATCPITQGSLVRLLIRKGQTADAAKKVIKSISVDPRHKFWPDSISFSEVQLAGVVGHRQVTDAYLAQLARTHDGRLATFDRGLAQLHSDVADLVPTG
ncbi:MAG TPA: TA system VapC family ribonuclease toxin [Mycobacterium sp.]|nr:TA system VapC family ribonuclease toxin [Mycobacterium sp.]